MAKRRKRRRVKDPTRTALLRRQWVRALNVRYSKLQKDIVDVLNPRPGIFANPFNKLVTNQFEFGSDPAAVSSFMRWLQEQIDQTIMEGATDGSEMWQNEFINRSYGRGMIRADAALAKQGITAAEVLPGAPVAQIDIGTATGQFGQFGGGISTVGRQAPIHLTALQGAYTRDFEALKDINSTMSGQIARVLTDSIEQGLGIREITRNLTERVDKIGKTRSRTMARTETVRLYNASNINETEFVAEQTGEDIKFEWVTAQDSKVRDRHAAWNGQIISAETARSRIGEPNCRCTPVPFVVSLDSKEKQTERKTRRKEGEEKIAA